uniref:Uncharacterized protein n=1 Tax=Cannabis sativa TaxID=3483 RepID=A0A803P975_CANSA
MDTQGEELARPHREEQPSIKSHPNGSISNGHVHGTRDVMHVPSCMQCDRGWECSQRSYGGQTTSSSSHDVDLREPNPLM